MRSLQWEHEELADYESKELRGRGLLERGKDGLRTLGEGNAEYESKEWRGLRTGRAVNEQEFSHRER